MQRFIGVLLVLTMVFSVLPSNFVYAVNDNIGGGDAGGETGSGSADWKYTSQSAGVRISLYWAEGKLPTGTEEEVKKAEAAAFNNSALRIGKVTHFLNNGINANYTPKYDTALSVYDYMHKDEKFSLMRAGQFGFFHYYTSKESVVASMPDSLKGNADAWKHWIKGKDLDNPDYTNISAITKLLGQEISASDFKSGIYTNPVNKEKKYGQYKLFIEPEISAYVDGKCMYVTLRDMIAMGEHQGYPTLTRLVSNLNLMFEYLANPMFLIDDEQVIKMKANSWEGTTWKKTGSPYMLNYDRSNNASSKAAMEKALKVGGQAYSSMGVGVFSPQRDAALQVKSYKVMKSFVQPIVNSNGSLEYVQVGAEMEMSLGDFLEDMGVIEQSKSTISEYITDRTVATSFGTAYLNDILTSPIKLDLSKFDWTKELPKAGSEKIEATADDIWSYNVAITTRIFLLCDELMKYKEFSDFETVMQMYTLKQEALKTAKTADEKAKYIKDMEDLMKEVMVWLDLDTSNEIHDSLGRIKNGQAKLIERTLKAKNTANFLKGAKYISDTSKIIMEDTMKGTEGVLYLRYFVDPKPQQINIIKTYKGGKVVDTQVVTTEPAATTFKESSGAMTVNIESFTDMREEGYKNADLVKLVTAKNPGSLREMPSKVIKTQKSLKPLAGLEVGEVIFVEWKIDGDVVKVSDTVPEWRLSQYKTSMGYQQKALMSMALKADKGHKASQSYITPSASYDYNSINTNGKVATKGNTPENMKFTDWLHTKALTKGTYVVTHNNANAAVDITGNYNTIKDTTNFGINAASWVTDSKMKSTLAKYDIESSTKSGVKAKSKTLTTALDYAIKNKDTYTHSYAVYKHHTETKWDYFWATRTVKDKDGKAVTEQYKDWYSYEVDVCDCFLETETLKPAYTPASYKLTVAFTDYKPINTDSKALVVKASKKEENGKTALVKQNVKSLLIYPEVPMLFQEDDGKESIVFAAGSSARKLSLVDYHTLTYNVYVKDTSTWSSTATDSKAKSTASAIGLGNLPVANKGGVGNISFDVKKSSSSNDAGELVVKSYALDISDNSLKSSWGNGSYNAKDAHNELLNKFGKFSKGTASENLDIAVPNGKNSTYAGPVVKNNITYKQKSTNAIDHKIVVRGGVVTEVDGKSLSAIKGSNPELYEALEGMKLVGSETVFKTMLSKAGSKLTESNFATLANKARGTKDIKTDAGWYFEDTTVLVVREYVTTYTLPISQFPEKIPMSVKGLETPTNKMNFYNTMSKGYVNLNYTMTSADLGTGLGKVKVYFEHNSRVGGAFGSNKPSYGVGNVSVTDSTFGGGF